VGGMGFLKLFSQAFPRPLPQSPLVFFPLFRSLYFSFVFHYLNRLVNSSTGKNINCSLKLKFLRLFLILVPEKGLSIIFSAFWRLSKNLELKECLCS